MEAKDGRGRDLRKAAGVRVGDVCKIEIKTRRVQNRFWGRGLVYCRYHPGDGKIRDPWASGSAQSFRIPWIIDLHLRSCKISKGSLASSIIFWSNLRTLIHGNLFIFKGLYVVGLYNFVFITISRQIGLISSPIITSSQDNDFLFEYRLRCRTSTQLIMLLPCLYKWLQTP